MEEQSRALWAEIKHGMLEIAAGTEHSLHDRLLDEPNIRELHDNEHGLDNAKLVPENTHPGDNACIFSKNTPQQTFLTAF